MNYTLYFTFIMRGTLCSLIYLRFAENLPNKLINITPFKLKVSYLIIEGLLIVIRNKWEFVHRDTDI